MAKEDISEKVKLLQNMGQTVYSISRLNSYNDCQYGYYRSYVFKNVCGDCGYTSENIMQKCEKCGSTHMHGDRGEQNVYAALGSILHDRLQDIHDEIATVKDMQDNFDTDVFNTTLFMSFPSEKIQDSWVADMRQFVDDFTPLNYDKIETERGFVTNIDGVWLQGFIDVMAYKGDEVHILDWKTSSAFSKDKLLHAGRQLVLYKLAVEEMLGRKVDKLAWYMLKYYDVHFDGKVKQCNRGSWVKDRSGIIKTQLKKLGYTNYEDMVEIAIENNNLDSMPVEVQDRFKLEPCIVWYDVSDELVQETKQYIKNTVSDIEGKDTGNMRLWECKNIYKDKGFFCKNLCGHSKNCKLFQWYLENNQ